MWDCAFFLCVSQGFHCNSVHPACAVACLGHEQASRAAYLLRGRVHVHCAFIPVLGTQGDGEFSLSQSLIKNVLPLWIQLFWNVFG